MRTALLCLAASFPVFAADLDFKEQFADPASRTASLTRLVPGTRDWYFYRALDHQLNHRDKEFRETMAEWKTASARKDHSVPAEGYSILDNRELLLSYQNRPESSMDLSRRLGLQFDATRPDAKADEKLPTAVTPDSISAAAFEKEALTRNGERVYASYRPQRLFADLDKAASYDPAQREWTLKHLERADHPALVGLLATAFKGDGGPGTRPNSYPVEKLLTLSQKEELLRLVPHLSSDQSFILSYVAQLKPAEGTTSPYDRQAQADYAKRIIAVTRTLPPALNHLKLAALLQHLRLQRELGNYPLDDFLAYLALPRQQHPLLNPAKENGIPSSALGAGPFSTTTGFPPVSDDEPLIRAYLDHFLADAKTPTAFAAFIPDKILNPLHAEARLLAGNDPDRWAKALDPAAFRALQELTTLEFAPGQPLLLGANDAVKLSVDLKNTPEVLIRVYPVDLAAYLASHGAEPDAMLDLDGLVPHRETKLTFSQSPLVRHRETLDFPDLTDRGVWVVETISRGVAARALIRKGSLIPYVEPGAGKTTVRVFDETGALVPDAAVTIGAQHYPAEKGLITIPGNIREQSRSAVITGGGTATRITLDLTPSAPQLEALFHLNREQALSNERATVRMDLRLTDHGAEIPLAQLSELTLTLSAGLSEDQKTERVISDGLKPVAEQTIDFLVPPNATSITLALSGKVKPATGGEPIVLTAEKVFTLNTNLDSASVASTFFSATTEGYRLDLRGRNGEPLSSRALLIEVKHRDYDQEVKLRVRTDQIGRVNLGTLPDITEVKVSGTDIQDARYLPEQNNLWEAPSADFVIKAGETLRLPLERPAATVERTRFGLTELVNNKPVVDRFDHLTLETGRLTLTGLPAGRYRLNLDGPVFDVIVSPGSEQDGLLVSPDRVTPKQVPVMPTLATTEIRDGNLLLRFDAASARTRVNLIGTRYLHPGYALEKPTEAQRPSTNIELFPSLYLTDRHLDGEMRYILDRRNTKAFPGLLLPRTGLLVNRWSAADVSQNNLILGDGSAGKAAPSAGMDRERSSISELRRGRGTAGISPDSPSIDFLASHSVLRYSLIPDSNGLVSVPLKDFANSQSIEVTILDRGFHARQSIPLAPSEPVLRDQRLMRPLDSAKHHLITRSTTTLAKGATATIDNAVDADWRAFTTLSEVWSYLIGATQTDKDINRFAFLVRWPSFSEEQKLELFSENACHEFHLFLARKDRPFFEKYVRPQLLEKTEPKFIDDYLLERDLTRYLRPYAWSRLNAAEKALLARALPEANARILEGLRQRWDLEAPDAETQNRLFAATLSGEGMGLQDSLGLAAEETTQRGTSYVVSKLKSIVIPSINFEDTTLEEAIDFLRLRTTELDTTELDPSRKGMTFVLRRPLNAASEGTDPGALRITDPGAIRIKELRLRNVPVAVALKYICDATRMRYKVDEYAITLVPQTESGEDIFTRSFHVPPTFREALNPDGFVDKSDPFADEKPKPRSAYTITDLLKGAGIVFAEGSSASLSGGTLLVTNTTSEIDKIEQLVAAIGGTKGRSKRSAAAAADPFAGGELPPIPPPDSEEPRAQYAAAPGTGTGRAIAPRQSDPDQTRIWTDKNYYLHRGATGESFIPLNRFWIDLAAWDGKGAFLSPYFNACTTNANEVLMTMSLLDVPFEAAKPQVTVDGSRITVKAKDAMVLLYKDTRETTKLAQDSPILVRQTLYRLDDRYRTEDGRKVENTVTGDLVAGVPYGLSLVVSNPTGNERRVDVLAQIPAGAITLAGQPVTLGRAIALEPYGVENLEMAFYFPVSGEFPLYPLHVSEGETVLAHTTAKKLVVAATPAAEDSRSWTVIARDGTNEAVLDHLKKANLNTINLDLLRWRLTDRPFFLAVTSILRERLHYSAAISAYGFLHRDEVSVREYLENSQAVTQLGTWLDSPVLDVRPVEHLDDELLEFDPLINPRAHRLENLPWLTHPSAEERYETVLDHLGWKHELSDQDQLMLTLWLQLQDRTEEALTRFDRINPAKLSGRLAYDYVNAVVLFAREKPAEARAIAARYANHPLTLWRDRFAAVIRQADEIAALATSKPAADSTVAATAPSLEIIAAPDGSLLLKHRQLKRATLQLFHVDVEVLFSKNPFLSGEGASLPAIRPNETREVVLTEAGETRVEFPEAFRQGNVLIAADAGSRRVLQVMDSRAMEIVRTPADRLIQALDLAGRPLPKTYVKVYTEGVDGTVNFHKDGYTDLRGKFDYLTHTGKPDTQFKRIAVLFVHPTAGAKTLVFEP